jgi:hypothetical protein
MVFYLISALDRFSSDLMRNLERFISDAGSVGTIWTCCVICLAHLAGLCHLTGQTVPATRTSMDVLYDMTLDKLENVSVDVHIEDYSHFDVLTGVRVFATIFIYV